MSSRFVFGVQTYFFGSSLDWLWVIIDAAKAIWEKWNIRAVVLCSLFLQLFLIVLAPLRKRARSGLWLIWFFYLVADWVATFCIGLIAKTKDDGNDSSECLVALWAPFLLVHLGGPDTITAFALEDNELWLRHLLAFVTQALTTAYAVSITIHLNTLWIPTVLVFVAGIIKYTERTRALYLASINTFRRSMVRDPDPGPNYAKLMEEHSSRKEAGLPTRIESMPEPVQKPNFEVGTQGNQTSTQEELTYFDVVNIAYKSFHKYRGLIVDMIFSFGERNWTYQIFRKMKASDALRVIEVELNYIYDVFYTKATVVRNMAGYILRFISFTSTVVALLLFISEDKRRFDKVDVTVTHTLMYGALALDIASLLMLIFSDQAMISSDETREISSQDSFRIKHFKNRFLSFRRPRWSKCKKEPYTTYTALSTPFCRRRWSETISGYNLITYCLRQCPVESPEVHSQCCNCVDVFKLLSVKARQILKCLYDKAVKYSGTKDLIEKLFHVDHNPLLEELWEFIVEELKRKSSDAEDLETMQRICSARGEWVLQESKLDKEYRNKLMPFVDPNEVPFDQSLLMWHIATHLCHANDRAEDGKRHFSKLLADYMLYLLVVQPTLMSAVAGIGKIRFQDTCAEAVKFFSKRDLDAQDEEELKPASGKREKKKTRKEKGACRKLLEVPMEYKPIDVKGDRSKSLLFDACRLAKVLGNLKEKKWEIMSQVWVEMLSYAACNCRPIAFVQQLSKGGELISIVWLLMFHLGLGTQFQIKDGHTRAKLIVESWK